MSLCSTKYPFLRIYSQCIMTHYFVFYKVCKDSLHCKANINLCCCFVILLVQYIQGLLFCTLYLLNSKLISLQLCASASHMPCKSSARNIITCSSGWSFTRNCFKTLEMYTKNCGLAATSTFWWLFILLNRMHLLVVCSLVPSIHVLCIFQHISKFLKFFQLLCNLLPIGLHRISEEKLLTQSLLCSHLFLLVNHGTSCTESCMNNM